MFDNFSTRKSFSDEGMGTNRCNICGAP
jgi:hypothetical protein